MLARSLLLLMLMLFGLVAAGDARAMPILIGAAPQPFELPTSIPFGDVTPDLATAINDAINNSQPLPTPRYQQVYDSGSFGASPLSIEQIRFFEDASQPVNAAPLGGNTCSDATPPCGTVTVRIGTTSLAVNALADGNYEDNATGGWSVFVQDVLLSSISAGGVLEFTGTPYVYDPDDGNLVIDVQFGDFGIVNDLTQGLNALLYEATANPESPVYSLVSNYDGLDNSSFGLVTEFEATVIPEPASGLLLCGGLALLGALRRNRARSR
jgi:hypothetical protein